MDPKFHGGKYKALTSRDLENIPQIQKLGSDRIRRMKAVAAVLPFKSCNYVVDELIDWNNIPEDPIFQLTFPQPEMLEPSHLKVVLDLMVRNASAQEVRAAARQIQIELNPHPSGQTELNVPKLDETQLPGMQHKYRETVLFFPSQGQTCHAYCTYCFRWAQFVGIDELKFANREADTLAEYVRRHREIESVLFTGGDPLIMKTRVLRRYIEPLLAPEMEHLQSIRIGTKATVYWPYRFVSDEDADDLLRLFEEVRAAGKELALMSHYSHPVELSTEISREALRRILGAGATVRCQAPLIRHVNDCSEAWAQLWREQVRLGAIPYYMFVERDTGPRGYFEVPLVEALTIYNDAYRQISGLARTVRGPSMSASPGKVTVDGVARIHGEDVLALSFIQARNPRWVRRPFFAEYDEKATWFSHLKPAFGESRFFFQDEFDRIAAGQAPSWDIDGPSQPSRRLEPIH